MKHIKYVARLLGGDKVEVLLLQQTHAGTDFACKIEDQRYNGRLFKRGNYGLYGHGGDSFQVFRDNKYGFANGCTLFLVSCDPVTINNRGPTMTCTLAQYKKFKELVIEYNKWGETQ